MIYRRYYRTPSGFSDMVMESDGLVLTSLLFLNSVDCDVTPIQDGAELPIFRETEKWLDCYFSGHCPAGLPPYTLEPATAFRLQVWNRLLDIPWGQTVTYGEIADEIAKQRGIRKMSSRAVGGAVGANPLCILIPCHRVIGANRSLTGYGGGIRNKIALLRQEGVDMSSLHI